MEVSVEGSQILVVDDNPKNIQVLGEILSEAGYQVGIAQNGVQALKFVASSSPDLILLDIMMPEMDGLETCIRLKESPNTKDIPVIFLTAKTQTEDIVKGFEVGAVDYVTKPFYSTELLARVRTHLQLKLTLKQIQDDLDLAVDFQRKTLSDIIEVPFLKIASKYIPYHGGVSGDVYDISLNRENEVNIFLGDATGHGIAAAFMTMMIQIALDSLKKNISTSEAMHQLNLLISSRERDKFITGVFLRITQQGFLTVTHAGHPPLIVIPADGTDRVLFRKGGTFLGMPNISPYVEESYQLQDGDKIIIYSDGITEWPNQDNRQFGLHRLIKTLIKHRNLEIELILNNLLEEVHHFSQGHECDDDLTVMMFQYVAQ